MYNVITWLIIVVCIFTVIIVLVQNAKGGGLAQNFAGQQQIMGVRKTTDFLEKATWTLAATIMVLSFVSVALIPERSASVNNSAVDAVMNNVQNQQTAQPTFGSPITATEDTASAK